MGVLFKYIPVYSNISYLAYSRPFQIFPAHLGLFQTISQSPISNPQSPIPNLQFEMPNCLFYPRLGILFCLLVLY